MNVFVTGGTGFVGREIVRQLHEAGHNIRLLVRGGGSGTALQLVERYGVEIRQGDVLDAGALPRAMHGMEAVIHLVGIISEVGKQTFENLHTRATQNVIQAALISGARRFVHMSALGTRANAVARYHRTKWAAEQIVSGSQLAWTTFRPSLIYGPDDQFVNLFARAARWSPVLPVLSSRQATFQPVAVECIARCFVRALSEPRSIGHTFDICGPASLSLNEIIRAILRATNRKRLVVPIPSEISKPMAAVTEFVWSKCLGKPPPLNRDQVQMLQENNVGEGQWTTDLFKLQHAPFEEGIARYLKGGP